MWTFNSGDSDYEIGWIGMDHVDHGSISKLITHCCFSYTLRKYPQRISIYIHVLWEATSGLIVVVWWLVIEQIGLLSRVVGVDHQGFIRRLNCLLLRAWKNISVQGFHFEMPRSTARAMRRTDFYPIPLLYISYTGFFLNILSGGPDLITQYPV